MPTSYVLKAGVPNELISSVLDISYLFEIEALWERDSGIDFYDPDRDKLEALKEQLFTRWSDQLNITDVEEVAEENWNAIWEANFDPVVIPHICTVKAPFHEIIPTTPFQVTILPEMAFGTGHHQTTSMMIQAIHDLSLAHKSVFDIGTGTGILAFFAELKGAREVFGIDIEEDAIRNCYTNQDLNNSVRTSFQVAELKDLESSKYDILLANINRNAILDLVPELNRFVAKSCTLITSGYLQNDRFSIEAALRNHWVKLRTLETGGWVCQVFEKRSKDS